MPLGLMWVKETESPTGRTSRPEEARTSSASGCSPQRAAASLGKWLTEQALPQGVWFRFSKDRRDLHVRQAPQLTWMQVV